MADTPSTGNTTPTVDQATPTDTTTAQGTGETVQLAQAAAAVQVSAPARGAEASLTVEPGQTVELGDPVIRFTQKGADLVIHWTNAAHTTLVEALAAGTPLILADGTPLTFEQILAQIPDLDPGAFAPAAVAPAAGPTDGRAAGGAFNTPFDNGTLGPEADTTALLLGTELQFGLLEFEEQDLPAEVADIDVNVTFAIEVASEATGNDTPTQSATISEEDPADNTGTFTITLGGDALTGTNTASVTVTISGTAEDADFTAAIIQAVADAAGGAGVSTSAQTGTSVTLTFDKDSSTSFDVVLTAFNDDLTDSPEDLVLTLSGGTVDDGSVSLVGGKTAATLTIEDQDADVTFAIEVASEATGNDTPTQAATISEEDVADDTGTFTVTLGGDALTGTNTASVTVTISGTAEDADFTAAIIQAVADAAGGAGVSTSAQTGTSVTLTFDKDSSTSFDVVLTAFDDVLTDSPEDLVLTLSGATVDDGSASLVGGKAAATLTITDVDIECVELRADFDAAVAAYSVAYPDVKGLGADDSDIAIDESDLKVGDLFVESNSAIFASIDVSNSVTGADDTVAPFDATNDLLDASGEAGDVTLVGDAYLNQLAINSVELDVDVSNFVDGGDDNLFNGFADDLRGGTGNDILVGDAFLNGTSADSMSANIDVNNEVEGGDDNTFNGFNDLLNGGAGNDLLVGDLNAFIGIGASGTAAFEMDLDVSNTVISGDGNQFNVFNDGLIGGDGNDTLVGDMRVFIAGPREIEVNVDIGNVVEGGSDNSFFAFNDMLDGGDGNDVLVGDIFFGGGPANPSETELDIDINNAVEGGSFGEGDADNNSFTAFSDMLEGGDGSDVLVGDIFYDPNTLSANELAIDVENSVSGAFFGEGGTADNNSFSVFDDILDGGAGVDLLVGDIFVDKKINSEMDHTINLSNSVIDGDNNTFSAFNDYLLAGPGGGVISGGTVTVTRTVETSLAAGSVQYVFFTIDADTAITITTDGPTIDPHMYLFVDDGDLTVDDFLAVDDDDGSPAGSFFNAIINTGDELGPVLPAGSYVIAVSDFFLSTAEAVAGINDGGLTGDVDITVAATDATVTVTEGGVAGDTLVGDYLIRFDDTSDTSNNIEINIDNDITGGVGNTFEAFGDVLIGDIGNDLLVGDMMLEGAEGGSVDVSINVAGNGDINLFNDHLCGDAGDDVLYGDFFADDGGSFNLTFNGLGYLDFLDSLSEEDFTLTIFEDVLDGASGNDDLIGGFGDDTLTGGAGDDTFLYGVGLEADTDGEGLANLSTDGNDTILDFGDGDDVVDLDALFDALGVGDGGAREALVALTDDGPDQVLTVTGQTEFSITFEGLAGVPLTVGTDDTFDINVGTFI